MSGTALDHQLVKDYLRQLDAAMYAMPAAPARELREQIIAHLDDALEPGASEAAVAGVLRRLGSPGELAAEAAAAAGTGGRAARTARSTRRGPLARRSLRTWVLTALALVAVGIAGARWADYYLSAYPLSYDQGADWWYQQDSAREVMSYASNTSQSTVPIRSGQQQGYLISIYNGSGVTETVVGDASGPASWNNPGAGSEQLTVSATQLHIPGGFAGQSLVGNTVFTLPVSIPPGQTRLVRVLWRSDVCLAGQETRGISALALRVRIGWFTRTQIIQQPGWYLAGPSRGRCAD
jgi:hypothetical protein